MSFRIAWDYAALAMFDDIRWPTSEDVDAEIHRFAAVRAPDLQSGAYRFRKSGVLIGVRVDRAASTVLVLFVYRRL